MLPHGERERERESERRKRRKQPGVSDGQKFKNLTFPTKLSDMPLFFSRNPCLRRDSGQKTRRQVISRWSYSSGCDLRVLSLQQRIGRETKREKSRDKRATRKTQGGIDKSRLDRATKRRKDEAALGTKNITGRSYTSQRWGTSRRDLTMSLGTSQGRPDPWRHCSGCSSPSSTATPTSTLPSIQPRRPRQAWVFRPGKRSSFFSERSDPSLTSHTAVVAVGMRSGNVHQHGGAVGQRHQRPAHRPRRLHPPAARYRVTTRRPLLLPEALAPLCRELLWPQLNRPQNRPQPRRRHRLHRHRHMFLGKSRVAGPPPLPSPLGRRRRGKCACATRRTASRCQSATEA